MSKLFLASNFYTIAPIVTRMLHDEQKGKKILFITTASEAEDGDKSWLNDDRDSLKKMGFEVINYTITGKVESDFFRDFKDIQ